MALSIKHPEADRLARELARRCRQTITEAVVEALRAELAREHERERVHAPAWPRSCSPSARATRPCRPTMSAPTTRSSATTSTGSPPEMVVDTSAVMAILQREPEAVAFAQAIEADPIRLISAVSVLEAGMLAESRKREAGALELDNLLARARPEVVAFDAEQAAVARLAFRRYGRGRHPARLNFGDCAAYALAKTRGEPLLFKGDDFARTDLATV